MHQEIVTNKREIDWLAVGLFTTNDNNISFISEILTHASSFVVLERLNIKNSHISKLSTTFNNQEQNKTNDLVLRQMKMNLDNVEAMAGLMGAIQEVAMDDMEISVAVWDKLAEGLVTIAQNGRLNLEILRINGETEKPNKIIAEKISEAGVIII